MNALRDSYGAALPGKLQALDAATRPLLEQQPREEIRRVLAEVHGQAHKLAGSAATFGYRAVSENARKLEDYLESLIESDAPLGPDQTARIEKLVAETGAAAGGEAADDDSGGETGTGAGLPRDAGSVIVVAPPGGAGDGLASLIETLGYPAILACEGAQGLDRGDGAPPRAIVVLAEEPGTLKVARAAADDLSRQLHRDVPIICVGHAGDFESQMRAVRAGAKAYLVQPVDPFALKREIQRQSEPALFTPFRILIMEDDDQLAAQCAGAFEGPGYAARVVKDPRELLERLATLDSELIVMDMSVAGTSGLDLARLVWQREDFRNIPIVFLSPGTEFNRQLLTIGVSDDYFVPRPVDTLKLCTVALRHLRSSRSAGDVPEHLDLVQHLDRIAALREPNNQWGAGSRIQRKQPSTAETGSTASPRVLVVDDDRHIVDGIAITLSAAGIEVLRAFSGEQGFKVALRERPDMIISDYAMPNGSGDQLLRRLKSTTDTKHIPVVILTGHTLDGRKDYALERDMLGRLGAVSYLAKPIDFPALVGEVARVLAPRGEAAP